MAVFGVQNHPRFQPSELDKENSPHEYIKIHEVSILKAKRPKCSHIYRSPSIPTIKEAEIPSIHSEGWYQVSQPRALINNITFANPIAIPYPTMSKEVVLVTS